jgi:hypothetical protein
VKRLLLLLLIAAPVALIQLQACSGQFEGQLCSRLNGDADCQDGLTCQVPSGATEGVCCSAGSSVAACLGQGTTTVPTVTTSTTGTGGTGGSGGTGGTGGTGGSTGSTTSSSSSSSSSSSTSSTDDAGTGDGG